MPINEPAGRTRAEAVLDVDAKVRAEVCAPLNKYLSAILPDMICASNDLLKIQTEISIIYLVGNFGLQDRVDGINLDRAYNM